MEVSKTYYPTSEDICISEEESKWVPESLKCFLQLLIPSSIKRSSIGQCIVQGSRPRTVISPILFGVGVQMDKSLGSKWLVNQLSRLGFSITSGKKKKKKEKKKKKKK